MENQETINSYELKQQSLFQNQKLIQTLKHSSNENSQENFFKKAKRASGKGSPGHSKKGSIGSNKVDTPV